MAGKFSAPLRKFHHLIFMKKTIHRAETRGLADHGWLLSRHTFSFASYHNPERMRFGVLRVLNDDMVEPGMGFGTHPHDNMEIISIPLKGALQHKDSMDNGSVISTGEVQIMSAGSGITHSEFNASKSEAVNFLQIWIFPKEKDIAPRYGQKKFPEEVLSHHFKQVISPEKKEDTLWINQNAWFSLGRLEPGMITDYPLHLPGNGVYVFVIEGEIQLAGEKLQERDGIGIWDTDNILLQAEQNSRILLMEIPMQSF